MAHGQRRIRVGIDTGGTFTDVVAFDEDTGELVTTKTPSTPANPADGFIAGIEKILDVLDATGDDITAVCHGTTVATNKLLEGPAAIAVRPAEHLGQHEDHVTLLHREVDLREVVTDLVICGEAGVQLVDDGGDGGRTTDPVVVGRGHGRTSWFVTALHRINGTCRDSSGAGAVRNPLAPIADPWPDR